MKELTYYAAKKFVGLPVFVVERNESEKLMRLSAYDGRNIIPVGMISSMNHANIYEDLETVAYAGQKLDLKIDERGTLRIFVAGTGEEAARMDERDRYTRIDLAKENEERQKRIRQTEDVFVHEGPVMCM